MKGGDLRLCAGFVNKPPLSMIAQPRYRSLADLRGARLGTSSLTEGTCHLMERMLAAHGLHQPKDFQFVLAGAHPQRWVALQAGTLDAAIQLVPFNYIAEEAGFPNLGDVDEYVPDFLFRRNLHAIKLGRTGMRGSLIGLLRALRRGVEALYEDPDGASAAVVGGRTSNVSRSCASSPAKISCDKKVYTERSRHRHLQHLPRSIDCDDAFQFN